MDDRTLRMIIRDENSKSHKALKKDLKELFMTRLDCYKHHSKVKVNSGDTAKQRAMFWGKITALITSLTTLIGLGIAFLTSKMN